MLDLLKTNAQDPLFVQLVAELDAGLAITDGEDHAFYDQYNQLDNIKYVYLALYQGEAVGCGAIKAYDDNTMEVKRMYVQPNKRGLGIATRLLDALEQWSRDLGANRCILETGNRQVEAVALYHKCNYTQIDNYGQYIGVANSICFEKHLL